MGGVAKHPMFPAKIDDQVKDLRTKLNYLKTPAVMSRLGVSATVIADLTEQRTFVDTAYAKTSDTDARTKQDTAELHKAIDAAHVLFRRQLDYYVTNNPAALPIDFELLSIPVPGTSSHLPPPSREPKIGNIYSQSLAVIVPFSDIENDTRAKPDGVQSMETYYKIGGEEPTDIGQLTERAVATASPLHLQFAPDDHFKMVYLAFRWIGTRGDYGPWSDFYKINITR